MSFCWIWGIYFMDYVGLRNDFGMEKKLGAVSGGIGIVRVMAAAWLISVMFSAVGMVLASLIFYAVGEGQNRIRVSVYMVVVLSVLIGGIYAGHRIGQGTVQIEKYILYQFSSSGFLSFSSSRSIK